MYHFCRDELYRVYGEKLEKFLKGKVGVCSNCGSKIVRVSRWWDELHGKLMCEVSCARGTKCGHIIRDVNSIERALNKWNDETNDDKCAIAVINY